jgi:A/G-specific adenine glycosylase
VKKNSRSVGESGVDEPRFASASRALLAWYRRNRRDLPWRETNDGWAIIVSEFMLQQTRVETVLRHYRRFLETFPSPASLARASEQEVLRAWSGLGYYRRARSLRRCAIAIGEDGFPRQPAELMRLPGVGAYTSAAVASIAFGYPALALDGNGERVLSRWQAIELPIKSAAARRELSAVGDRLLDRHAAGEWNQALMELGATVCQPKRALCAQCPLSSTCRSRDAEPLRLPNMPAKRSPTRVECFWAVVREGERLLVERRAADASFLAGFWQLPELRSQSREQWPSELAARGGGRRRIRRELGRFLHTVTFRRIEVQLIEFTAASLGDEVAEAPAADLPRAPLGEEGVAWLSPDDLQREARSAMLGKALRLLAALPSEGPKPGRRRTRRQPGV